MENRDTFYIRRVQNVGTENKCPACGDSFTTNYLAVHDSGGLPICELCAWEKDAALAALLFLSDTACAYHMAEPPPHIVDGLEQRQGDPERLKRKLQESPRPAGGMGPQFARRGVERADQGRARQRKGRDDEKGPTTGLGNRTHPSTLLRRIRRNPVLGAGAVAAVTCHTLIGGCDNV